MTVFKEKLDAQRTTQETTQETNQETNQETTREKIIGLLKLNPKYTKEDLKRELNRGDSTIKEHLANLKKDAIIKRVGSTKSGYWEVTDNYDK